MAEETDFEKLLQKESTKPIDAAKAVATPSKVDAAGQLLSALHKDANTGIVNYQNGGSGVMVKNGTNVPFTLRELQGQVHVDIDAIPDGLNRSQLSGHQNAINALNKTLGAPELNIAKVEQLSGKPNGPRIPMPDNKVLELTGKLQAGQHETNQIIKAFATGDEGIIKHTLQAQEAARTPIGNELETLLNKPYGGPHNPAPISVDDGRSEFAKLLQGNPNKPAAGQASLGDSNIKSALEAGENSAGAAKGIAETAADGAKTASDLIPEEKLLTEAAEAAEKAGAKALGKTALKSLPIIGAGVVVADVASAAEDTYESAKSGNYHDAAIDAARTVSKAGFGIAGQAASPTVVGGLAVNAAGESVDYALQQLKSSGAKPNDIRVEAFKNEIHQTEASKGVPHAEAMAANPDLQKPVTAYGLMKHEVTKNGGLNEQNQQVLSHVEKNMSTLIEQDRVSEIKLPNVVEKITSAVDHTKAPELTPG